MGNAEIEGAAANGLFGLVRRVITEIVPEAERDRRQYWRSNLKILGLLLGIWAAVSFGCSIVFVDQLDRVRIGGFRLGFWFAQQGSIYVFLVLIAVYVRWMNRLDREHGLDDREQG